MSLRELYLVIDPTELYAREVHRVGGLILGAQIMTAWRPTDARLRTIVDTIDVVTREHGDADVRQIYDVLREVDPTWGWSAQLHSIMARYDEVVSRAERLQWVLEAEELASAAYDRAMAAAARAADAMEDLKSAQELAARVLSAVGAIEDAEVAW